MPLSLAGGARGRATRARAIIQTCRNLWINNPTVDAVVAVGGAIALTVIAGDVFASGAATSTRHGWYQTLAGLATGLLGFAVTSVTIFYAVNPGERLSRVFSQVGHGLARLLALSLGSVALGDR